MKPLSVSSLKKSIFFKLFFIFSLMFASTQSFAMTFSDIVVSDDNIVAADEFYTVMKARACSNDDDRFSSVGYKIDGGTCYNVDTPYDDVNGTYCINISSLLAYPEENTKFLSRFPIGWHTITLIPGTTNTNACDDDNPSKSFAVSQDVLRESFLVIENAVVSGDNVISISEGKSAANVIITVEIKGSNSNQHKWLSTSYKINNGTCKNVDTSDKSGKNIYSNSFNIPASEIAALPAGNHTIIFNVSRDTNTCDTDFGNRAEEFRVTVVKEGATFDCQHLYIGGHNGRNPNYAEVSVTGAATFTGTEFYINDYNNKSDYNENPTLAIGPYKDKITLYWWDYMMEASTGSAPAASIYYMQNGSTTSAIIPQNVPRIDFFTDRLSGGTANQKTGEIYLLPEPSLLGLSKGDKIVSILSPDSNGVFALTKQSGQLNFTIASDDRAYASDMAIDADGNAYLLVRDSSSNHYKLLKINPQDWSYDFVQLENNIDIGSNNKIWGMAFLNGKLYAADNKVSPLLHAIDPIKGGKTKSGTVEMMSGSSPYGYGIDDIASCQTASAITGKVYLDKNGDGKIDGNDQEGGKYQFIPNVAVEIYDSTTGAPLGSQTTNSFGEYSFLVELQKTYYIRLRQPQINGANTHQTWASGGKFGWASSAGIGSNGINTVTPACYGSNTQIPDTPETITWYSGTETKERYTQSCYGNRIDGIDSSSDGISTANYYSKVEMITDLSVAHADFALGPIDRGDAPKSYRDASHSIEAGSSLKIGETIDADDVSRASANAQGDDENGQDDEEGVLITIPSENGIPRTLPLDSNIFRDSSNITLFAGVSYIFTVKVSEGGYLSAWTHINKTIGTTGSFTERMHNETEIEDGGAGDEDGVKNGEIVFTYVIPRTASLESKQNIFFRFRYSLAKDGHTQGFNPDRGNTWWNTHPWSTTGEVEDYGVLYNASAAPFYCSVLYATTLNGTIYGFANPAVSTSFIDNDFLFWFNSTKYGNMGSIAIGAYKNKIAMFSWSYSENKTMKYVYSGESNVSTLSSPSLSIPNSDKARFWSGGARHPQNEKMYLSGYVNATFHSSPTARILTYDGNTGGQVSGNLTPASPSDQINGQLASDVFLGADGHIYTLGAEGGSYYLLHINPDNWQYTKSAAISGLGSNKLIYGLAFFGGKIYATTLDKELHEIDPATGVSKQISGSVGDAYYDLASCQVAPIITGTLYFDKNADGDLTSAEKSGTRLANVTVELYDQNKVYLSTATTNANGEYSFMLNGLGDFYIRVKQPHIGGYKAVQTWASGSDTAVSSVHKVCYQENSTSDGECYGVNGPLFEDGGGNDLANANYYSILTVKDSSVPAMVDFGFSGVDRSDAPLRYGEARHSAIQKIISLGGSLDSDLESMAQEDANKDSHDDGVQIKKAGGGSYTDLQGVTLEANSTYIFKVSLNGNMSSEGVLNAWISLHNVRGKLNGHFIPIFTQSNISGNYVEFNYTVPGSMFGDEYVYLRFRFALGNATCQRDDTTLSFCSQNITLGEVEDYRVSVINNNPRVLKEIFNEDLYGDVRIIGNTIMARTDTSFNPICPVSIDENNDANSKNNTAYWNVDNFTSSSSSAYLNIPNGAMVKAAFLRWQGANIRNIIQYNNATEVTLMTPSGGRYPIKAEIMNWYNHAYQGTANITNIVKSAGAGNYAVGDIFTSFNKNSYGAWAIIVVYDNENDNNEVLRKAVVYDGFAPVGDKSANVDVTDFRTSSTGSVNSKMYLFAGEGDNGGGDSVTLNGVTVGGSDPISGGITRFGANVLDRNASCVNNLAADVHTYNVGTNGTDAIGNGVTEANVKFSSASDTYYLGLVGFSIQLYEPRVCYYIDSIINKDGLALFENGTFGNNVFLDNQNYTFNIFIANMQDNSSSSERDTAYNVQAHMTYLKPEQLNYTAESTDIDNIGDNSGYIHQTDKPSDDLGEYMKYDYKHTWRLGHGADNSKGGSFGVSYDLNTAEKSLIKLGMQLGRLDANASKDGVDLVKYLRFQASYNSGVSNITRIKDIAQCRDMNLRADSDPVIGSFNVVNENLPDSTKQISIDADHEDNALYTQITGKSFYVKLIALEAPSGSANSGSLKLVDYDTNRTTFFLELINGEEYDTCVNSKDNKGIEKCCEMANEVGRSNITGDFNQDNNTIGIKKIHIVSNVTVEYGKFRVVWYKTIEDNATRYSCSLDRFAIRPDRFGVGNITGTTKLIGGADNNATLSAYDYNSTALAAYNKTASELTYNAVLNIPTTCDTSQINTDINSTNFNVTHGNFLGGEADLAVWYNNVGNISAVVIDSNYTNVDRKYYNKTVVKNDCHENSSSNIHMSGRVGCDIASDNVSMIFVPKEFAAQISVKNANSGDFTYLSNNASMAAEVTTTNLAAKLGYSGSNSLVDNQTATNYHQGCFAKDVTYKFKIENNNFTDYNTTTRDDPGERVIFFEKDTIATLKNNNNASDGMGEFKIKQNNFMNGEVGSIKFGFNFNRTADKRENPFILYVPDDINITNSAIYDDDTNSTNATVSGGNITFFYGRVFIDNYEDADSITAAVLYELFCQNCTKTYYDIILADMNLINTGWYLNKRHNATAYGDIPLTKYSRQGSSNIANVTSPAGGRGSVTIENNAGYTPYADTIHASPDPWLIYNPYNPSADEIDFTVRFIGGPGNWAGKGQVQQTAPSDAIKTGVTINAVPDNKTKSRVSW